MNCQLERFLGNSSEIEDDEEDVQAGGNLNDNAPEDQFARNYQVDAEEIEDQVINQHLGRQQKYQRISEWEWHTGKFKVLPELHDGGYDDDWYPIPSWRSKRQAEVFEARGTPRCRGFGRQNCN